MNGKFLHSKSWKKDSFRDVIFLNDPLLFCFNKSVDNDLRSSVSIANHCSQYWLPSWLRYFGVLISVTKNSDAFIDVTPLFQNLNKSENYLHIDCLLKEFSAAFKFCREHSFLV